jgi:hypothetical protein
MEYPASASQLHDLDYILEHVDDTDAVFTRERTELNTASERALPPRDSRYPAGSVS